MESASKSPSIWYAERHGRCRCGPVKQRLRASFAPIATKSRSVLTGPASPSAVSHSSWTTSICVRHGPRRRAVSETRHDDHVGEQTGERARRGNKCQRPNRSGQLTSRTRRSVDPGGPEPRAVQYRFMSDWNRIEFLSDRRWRGSEERGRDQTLRWKRRLRKRSRWTGTAAAARVWCAPVRQALQPSAPGTLVRDLACTSRRIIAFTTQPGSSTCSRGSSQRGGTPPARTRHAEATRRATVPVPMTVRGPAR